VCAGNFVLKQVTGAYKVTAGCASERNKASARRYSRGGTIQKEESVGWSNTPIWSERKKVGVEERGTQWLKRTPEVRIHSNRGGRERRVSPPQKYRCVSLEKGGTRTIAFIGVKEPEGELT